ncbi:hypothetical protein ACNPKB_16270 [Shewanella marisflavi]|uniref:hypothetical protein n=1 Tax=Shewanella marisflavi TaxID=260364 RepID=UPI003AAF5214
MPKMYLTRHPYSTRLYVAGKKLLKELSVYHGLSQSDVIQKSLILLARESDNPELQKHSNNLEIKMGG